MVPEERMTAAIAVCRFTCEINATALRSFSTDFNSQRSTAMRLAESRPINRTFISADPNLPNICSTEASTASLTPCAEIVSSPRNFTRRYRCLGLFVVCRPLHDLDSLFEFWLLHPQAILLDNLERDLRYAPQRCVKWKAERMQ